MTNGRKPDWIEPVPEDAPMKPAPMCCKAPSCSAMAMPPTAMAISAAPPVPIAMLQGAGNLLIAPRRAGRNDRALVRSRVRPVRRRGSAISSCACNAPASALPGADEARAHGDVPETRASLCWLLRRAYSVGNSDMRVLLKHRPGPVRAGRGNPENPGLALVVAAGRRHPRGQPESQGHRRCRSCSAPRASSARCSAARYNEYAVVHGE